LATQSPVAALVVSHVMPSHARLSSGTPLRPFPLGPRNVFPWHASLENLVFGLCRARPPLKFFPGGPIPLTGWLHPISGVFPSSIQGPPCGHKLKGYPIRSTPLFCPFFFFLTVPDGTDKAFRMVPPRELTTFFKMISRLGFVTGIVFPPRL